MATSRWGGGGNQVSDVRLLDVERFRWLPRRKVAWSDFLLSRLYLGKQRRGWDVGTRKCRFRQRTLPLANLTRIRAEFSDGYDDTDFFPIIKSFHLECGQRMIVCVVLNFALAAGAAMRSHTIVAAFQWVA
jgi:hypothetical protein